MADTIKATPRNQTLGALVNAYDKTLGPLLNKYEVLPQIPLIGGMTLGDLGANSLRNVANEMSYGNYQPVRNARNIQTLTVDPATLDVATMIPIGGIAAKIGKPLAKAVGRGAAERMAQHIDDLGLNQYIIPPQGNLNFTTRLDEQIKGPETQTVYDLLKQVQGKPGVTKEGLKQIAAKYPDSAAKVTKKEFAESIPASEYDKVDLARATENDMDQYIDMAHDEISFADVLERNGVPSGLEPEISMLESGDISFDQLDPAMQRIVGRFYGVDATMTPNDIGNTIAMFNQEMFYDAVRERADELFEANIGAINPYAYEGIQRLVADKAPHDYFEFGVTHPSQTGEYRHYSSGEAPEGLIGHVRGSYAATDPLMLEGDVLTKPNSYVIEEIQSDAQKGSDQVGPLHQVHGTLLKSAIQDAAEHGADYVYVPTSYPIGKTRHADPENYAAIYDQALVKEGLEPLRKIPGIEINVLQGRHLTPNFDIIDVPYYHEIKLSPESKEHILTGPGQSIPGYAAGGLVASDYDDESISQMADDLLGYGNRVTGEAKGKGALGEIRMPDGRDVMTEYSINVDGREMPSIVEGMHPADVNYIRETGIVPEDAVATAIRSANKREARGKSAFYAKGGEVKDPFADLSVLDKAGLLAKAAKYRVQYNKQAVEHGKYPEELFSALKAKYRDQVGNSRVNRSPLDAALNYGGGYDFGVRQDVPADIARDMGKTYQYVDYFFSPFTGPKSDAVGDYYENMAGVEAGIKERGRRASDAEIQRRSAEYGRRTSRMLPQHVEENYAEGGLVYNDEEINNLANQLLGA